uniref:Ovule protein n=1 Tax=Romanomermis culicivorax TaxID=13658 RepID=A0A915LB15_ROMCU
MRATGKRSRIISINLITSHLYRPFNESISVLIFLFLFVTRAHDNYSHNKNFQDPLQAENRSDDMEHSNFSQVC